MEARRNETATLLRRESQQPESGIIVREIDCMSDHGGNIPSIYNHVSLFVVDGLLEATVNGKPYQLRRGCFLDCLGHTVSLKCASRDARGYLLLLTKDYMAQVLKEKRPFTPAYILHILQNPVVQISPLNHAAIIHGMENLRQATASVSFRHAQDILQSKVLIFFLELSDILGSENLLTPPPDTAKYKRIFTDFLNLLSLHIRHEHSVTFYAEQLNITPQYLRRIVKELAGRNAYQVISDFLNREICKSLLETSLTLQEIAEELHFSDQAVLSKFFKRNNGMSPLKYRNQWK